MNDIQRLALLVQDRNEQIAKLNTKIANMEIFITNLESQTCDFDKLCDCALQDGCHDKKCMTMNARNDLANLNKG